MPAGTSIIGRTFTRLFVFAEAPIRVTPCGRFRRSWVRCTCGSEFIVYNSSLIRGATKSCGCLNRELIRERATIHGNCSRTHKTEAYSSWLHLKARCNNRTLKNYGARGVIFCEGVERFPAFFALMGECPPGLTIDRWPNKYGNYTCGRCQQCLQNGWPFNLRWATMRQQNRNHRRNRIYTINGFTECLTDLATRFGIHPATVNWRLRHGWEPERAFLHPLRRNQYS